MSQWTDRVRLHAVWTTLASVGPAIDKALDRESIDASSIDSLERLRTVLAFSGKRLAATEPAVILPGSLDNLNKQFVAIQASVDAFAANGDPAQLVAANGAADNVLAGLASVLGVQTSEELAALGSAAAEYRNTLVKYLHEAIQKQPELAAKNQALETKIAALEAALTAEQQRLATLATEQQSQFSAAQDKRATDFAASQADHLAKFTSAATDQQTQFSTDQDTRRTAFSEFQTESQQQLSALLSAYDQKLKEHQSAFLEREKTADETNKAHIDALQTQYKESAEEILKEIRRHKSEVEALVGVIGNLGVTSGYQKVANHARKMLYTWQALTVGALGFLMFIAVTMAFPKLGERLFSTQDDVALHAKVTAPSAAAAPLAIRTAASPPVVEASVDRTPSDSEFYRGLAVRVFLSMACIVFAAYSARQARHFLAIEGKNRKRALELEAVGPYIAQLSKEAQDEFLIKLGERSFGVSEGEQQKLDDDPVSIADTIKPRVLGEYLQEVLKGFKGK